MADNCWESTKNFISSFLVYDTVSIVRIKDKRLALLHYTCLIAIIIYIFIYTIWYNQAYYSFEAPVGTVRINPMAPPERGDNWTEIADLKYCQTDKRQGKLNGFDILPCKYYDSSIDVFPQAVDSSITIASRIKFSVQNTSNEDFNTSDTKWCNETPVEQYFLADIENFTLQIDHTFFAPNLKIQGNARDMKGFIDFKNSNDTKLCLPVEKFGIVNVTDILSVCTLLKAANIDIDKESVQVNESIRDSGAIFLVFLDYQNMRTRFLRENTHYSLRVELLNNTEYKAVQAVYTKKLKERTIYDRHGLHFVFLQTGKLVVFDFQVFLLSLVSGMGMLAFSTTIVDLISTKLLGNKDVVSNLKYRTTPNLTEFTNEELLLLASKIRRTQEQELALTKNDVDAPERESSMSLREPLVDREVDD